MANADIIQNNLELMFSLKKDGMLYCLKWESMSSRGLVLVEGKNYDSVFANFHYNKETGEMLRFSNEPASIGAAQGRFKIAADFKRDDNPYFRIVNVLFDEKASDNANRIIMTCLNLYNDTYAKS